MSSRVADARSIFVDGAAGRLHLTDFGGEGPVVLALHGVTGGGFLWAAMARELAGQARIVALDFRGHGKSGWSDARAYATSDHIDDLRLVFGKFDFGARPIRIIGSSWGALAAIGLMSDEPALASGLMIVDVEPSFTASETDVFPRPYRFAGITNVVEWEIRANPNALPQDVAAFAHASVVQTPDGPWLRRHDPYFLTHWPFRNDDRWQQLRALGQHVHIVHGSNSFVRREVCDQMVALNPDWAFSEIPQSGHLVPLEQPALLAKAARDFLSTA